LLPVLGLFEAQIDSNFRVKIAAQIGIEGRLKALNLESRRTTNM
jgi:hypothetical protein